MVVRAVLLTVHVVGFLGTQLAEVTRAFEHCVGIVDVDMNLRLALGAGEYE